MTSHICIFSKNILEHGKIELSVYVYFARQFRFLKGQDSWWFMNHKLWLIDSRSFSYKINLEYYIESNPFFSVALELNVDRKNAKMASDRIQLGSGFNPESNSLLTLTMSNSWRIKLLIYYKKFSEISDLLKKSRKVAF